MDVCKHDKFVHPNIGFFRFTDLIGCLIGSSLRQNVLFLNRINSRNVKFFYIQGFTCLMYVLFNLTPDELYCDELSSVKLLSLIGV